MGKRYFVDVVKCGVAEAGPGVWQTNVSVKYVCDGINKWLALNETEGFPSLYLTDEDIFDRLMDFDFEDGTIEKALVKEFDGIKIEDEYKEIEAELRRKKNNPASDLLRYIVDLAHCEMSENDRMIKAGEQKFADEIVY